MEPVRPSLHSPTTAFLPLDVVDGCVEVRDLDPPTLREAAKHAVSWSKRYGKVYRYTAVLSFVTKSLGLSGGFTAYADHYKRIQDFCVEHDLRVRQDVYTPRAENLFGRGGIGRRQVSDRVFHSGLELPERIFTGYDRLRPSAEGEYEKPLPPISPADLEAWREWIERVRRDPRQAEAALASEWMWLDPAINLLGDQLVAPRRRSQVALTYPDSEIRRQFQTLEPQTRALVVLFRNQIEKTDAGWLEVRPFSECLVFLKGRDGAYDFVFPNLRAFEPRGWFSDDGVDRGDPFVWDYFRKGVWREEEDAKACDALNGKAKRHFLTVLRRKEERR